MLILTIVFQAALWIWFLGCTVTYRFGRVLLVEGVGVKSAEFIVQCLYSAGIILFYCCNPVGKWFLPAVLCLWFITQFRFHWYYTIFGSSEEKLKGYNGCFRGTVRIFPQSDTRLIPDMYHIVLHLLILANIILCAVQL